MKMRNVLLATVTALALFAGPAFANPLVDSHDTNQTSTQLQGQVQGQQQNAFGGSAHSTAISGSASGAIAGGGDASSGGNSTQSQNNPKTTAIAIAPPSYSYSPGAAANDFGITTSYAIGFPAVGGGYGESSITPTAHGIEQLADLAHKVKVEPDAEKADNLRAGLCEYYGGFAVRAKLNCE